MIEIDWKKDYQGDFICPNPDCGVKKVKLYGVNNLGKQLFNCLVCGTTTVNSIELNPKNLSRIAHYLPITKPFTFEEDSWDLRTINCFLEQQSNRFIAYFESIQVSWFKVLVKKYIYHLCKSNKSYSTIFGHLSSFKIFSRYLVEKNINGIEQINRDVILDFIIWDKIGDQSRQRRLGTLRNFFTIGNLQGWFEIDRELIRNEDYPKRRRGNPNPISDTVREQIEKNLHKLPDSIARMWIIAFFTAMRPSELALLKKNCLVQEGSHWKVTWQRRKTNDQHEVPVTRIIAKVIQEQQEYIQELWGDEWEYLFCHYHGVSKEASHQPKLKPIKKVIPKSYRTLKLAIRCLIEAEDIRDDNGKLASFSPRLVRPTRLTQLFEQGHDLAVVSAWAGHQQLATTSTYYTHVSCEQIEKETRHIQKALFNAEGQKLSYESLPKSFWKNPCAHQLELSGDHINTPIYGYCGLPLDQRCDKFRACYTCPCFVAVPEKLTQYVKTRDELRAKETRARANGQDVLVEQFGRQADQLDKIIASLEVAA